MDFRIRGGNNCRHGGNSKKTKIRIEDVTELLKYDKTLIDEDLLLMNEQRK